MERNQFSDIATECKMLHFCIENHVTNLDYLMEFFQFIAGFRLLMATTHLNIRCKFQESRIGWKNLSNDS